MTGGVNGVMLTWQECETEYNAVKTVECYQRLTTKDGQKMVVHFSLAAQRLVDVILPITAHTMQALNFKGLLGIMMYIIFGLIQYRVMV
jgi:hypothetical protein